jgi:hypothetical protein
MTLFLYVLHCKQAIGNGVMTVGYVMKPSREEDFAKVSSLQKNEGIFRSGKRQKRKERRRQKK